MGIDEWSREGEYVCVAPSLGHGWSCSGTVATQNMAAGESGSGPVLAHPFARFLRLLSQSPQRITIFTYLAAQKN
jgi:hypothetical protein